VKKSVTKKPATKIEKAEKPPVKKAALAPAFVAPPSGTAAKKTVSTATVSKPKADVPATKPPVATASSSETAEQARGRRRRRGGRGRGGNKVEAVTADVAVKPVVEKAAPAEESSSTESNSRRRSRRRGGSTDAVSSTSSAQVEDRGSTRINSKRARRRDTRDPRRRTPLLSEAQFLARRESVDRAMVIRQIKDRTQVAILEDNVLVEHYVVSSSSSSLIGNVYLGKVQNVLPGMEAAFIDIGKGRNAVLYAGEVNWDLAGLEGQPKRIELALSTGDSVLVQVTKDPIGQKGARLTSQISLPGRYLVYVPGGSMKMNVLD
jgi:ribonuclease E